MTGKTIIKVLAVLVIMLVVIGVFCGCHDVSFIPGASYGYYVWEENGEVHISWSIDRKESAFSGSVTTDGRIENAATVDWEAQDSMDIDGNSISYTSTLSREDYTDGIILSITDYDYIELDLKINDGYDLSRVNVGSFLQNPEVSPFRIGPGYFDEIRAIPWYKRHPFSGLFNKLFSNKYFTFLYIFIIGIIVIEIIRVTVFSARRRKKLYTGISYVLLICLEIIIYFILKFFIS